jgi:kynureninase
VRPDTLLISVMQVNNETGAIQPIEAIAALALERGILLHMDAAQAAGKFSIDLGALPIDLLSLSAHKFHGPKGVGCLLIRDRSRCQTQAAAFIERQALGAFSLFALETRHLPRLTALMRQYVNLPMDLADASLVVLAEHLGHGRILSTDQRDFDTYRRKNNKPFTNILLIH